MSGETDKLQSTVTAFQKLKQVKGTFKHEDLVKIIGLLETADKSVEKKMRMFTIFSVLTFVAAIGSFFLEALPPFVGIGLIIAGIVLIVIRVMVKGYDLDNEFRLFFKPLLQLLEEDIKPGSVIKVNLELRAPDDKKFSKGKSQKYSKGVYHRCFDHTYQRHVGHLQMRLYDGNRLIISVNEEYIKTSKTKRNARGKYKTKYVYTRTYSFHLRLRINREKFTCPGLPAEAAAAQNIAMSGKTVRKQKIKYTDTQKGPVLDISYDLKNKTKGFELSGKPKEDTAKVDIVPQQVLKLYSFLQPAKQPAA